MLKLKKADLKKKQECLAALKQTFADLKQAVENYNESREEDDWDEVSACVTSYNEAVEEANNFISARHDDMDEYYSGRSDTWQEGENGDAYSEWMDAWELELDEAEINRAGTGELADEPDGEDIESFENLPDSKDEV